MNILLIAPSGSVASALEQLSLDSAEHEVTVLSREDTDSDIRTIRVTPGARGVSVRADRMLGGSAAGRNLFRLSPLDHGRRFAAAARRDRDWQEAASTAQLIVVLERDGLLTGWQTMRRLAPASVRAVNGIAPARAVLDGVG
ncbi:hypothetical protein ACFVAE_05055 [Microbacterium sp. NPDC057659]|uniref:hypothetical protein n=1 Tax=Microbacterium sp. NPDC057659 TaxID=3346198 RepID=UPI00366C367E